MAMCRVNKDNAEDLLVNEQMEKEIIARAEKNGIIGAMMRWNDKVGPKQFSPAQAINLDEFL